MGTILDGLDDHEGYGARLTEAALTSTRTKTTARFDAYVAACGCGWRGGRHAATEDGYNAALGEWERTHAGPLLARTVPADVRHMISDVAKAVGQLIEDRPVAGLEALRTLAEWADAAVARIQRGPTTARQQPPRGRSLGL